MTSGREPVNAPQEHDTATGAEMIPAKWRTSIGGELSAMQAAFSALSKLSGSSKHRAMYWLNGALFDSPGGDGEELPF